MAQTFTCPSCGAPLNYQGDGSATISCPYCYSSVIVPQELRAQAAHPVAPDVSMALSGKAHRLRELSSLVRSKQRDRAIQVYQQVYGASREDAERLVDQLMGGSGMVITSGLSGSARGIKFDTSTGSVNIEPTASPSFPASPLSTNPANYTVAPQTTVYTTTTGSGRRSNGWLVGCFVVITFLVVLGVAGALLVGGLSFLPSTSQINISTPVANLPDIKATTTAAFALATSLASDPTRAPKSSATPSNTPEPTEDAEGTATAQALAAADTALVTAQTKLPVLFSDKFDVKRTTWETGNTDNDYLSGTRTITSSVYRWTLSAKQNVASFVYPNNIKPVSDFYASVDVKVVGPDSSDAGLVFRHKSDDTGWYYFALGGDNQYSFSYYGDSGWETLVDWNGNPAIKPGATNTLSVAAKGGHFVLLINNQAVTSIDDDRIDTGDVGLAIELANGGDSGVFSFDNFQIRAAK